MSTSPRPRPDRLIPRYRSHGEGLSWLSSRDAFREIGEQTVIEGSTRIFHPEKISIGDQTYIAHECILKGYPLASYSIRIGSDCWIGECCYLHGAGGINIGDRVGIGPHTVLLTSQHKGFLENVMDNPIDFAPITILSGADIGFGTKILPGVTIGKGAIVGAGSTVTKDIGDFEVWAGNPARFIRDRIKDSGDRWKPSM